MTNWADGTSTPRTGALLEQRVLNSLSARLWNTGDTICRPNGLTAFTSATVPVSGQIYWMGGPGMVVPAGTTVRGIEWLSVGAATAPTHQWFVLGMPDDAGNNTVTVLATSKDDLTTAWGANATKKLSLLVADGGSGPFTPTVDTPVYAGIVQVATTPATIRGTATSGNSDKGSPLHWGAGSASLTIQSDLAGIVPIAGTSIQPAACRLSSTST